MTLDATKFLFSLAAAMAAAANPAAPAIPVFTAGGNLFALQAVEAFAGDPYAVLRCYGGPPPALMWRIERMSIQAAAFSKTPEKALTMIRQLYETLYVADPIDAANQLPRVNWTIPGKALDGTADASVNYLVYLVSPGPSPAIVGIDQRSMNQASFNFDVRVTAISTI